MPALVTHPRLAPRRGGRVSSWWGKAWQRAVEEAAYTEADLRAARSAARRGEVGAITLGPGSLLAAVREGDDAWTVTVAVPALGVAEQDGLIEVVAAESGRIASLLAGDLPHDLVEHAEETGVELLPYGGELATTCTCTCSAYLDPCGHALAVLVQAGWLMDADPFVLLTLRGLTREELLARLHQRSEDRSAGERRPAPDADPDLDTAIDAVLRARRLLELVDDGAPVPDHLF